MTTETYEQQIARENSERRKRAYATVNNLTADSNRRTCRGLLELNDIAFRAVVIQSLRARAELEVGSATRKLNSLADVIGDVL